MARQVIVNCQLFAGTGPLGRAKAGKKWPTWKADNMVKDDPKRALGGRTGSIKTGLQINENTPCWHGISTTTG